MTEITVLKYVALVCASWLVWLPITFWCGRVFCRYICPLGLSQSLVAFVTHPKSSVRRVCTQLPRTRLQRVINWLLVIAYAFTPVAAFISPWGIFGRVLTLFIPGIAIFAAILVSAAFGKGRLWCNWICPFGTIFDFAARLGWHQDRITTRCKNCRKCFGEGK